MQRQRAWRVQAGDYKTGRAYGERPPMVIAPAIYPEVRPQPSAQLGSHTLPGGHESLMVRSQSVPVIPLKQGHTALRFRASTSLRYIF